MIIGGVGSSRHTQRTTGIRILRPSTRAVRDLPLTQGLRV